MGTYKENDKIDTIYVTFFLIEVHSISVTGQERTRSTKKAL